MSFDIAYIVSHGFASRMITQTNLLGKLVNAKQRVAVITPDIEDPILKEFQEKFGISLFEFNEKNASSENYMFKRKYFLEDLNSNSALFEKHIYATNYNRSKNPWKRVRPFYYKLIHDLIPYFPIIRKRFISKEKKYFKSTEARDLIEQIKPRKLISTYPVNFNEATLLYYGNKNPDVETWIHLLSWDNITCKGKFPETATKYISWGAIMNQELQSYYQIANQNIYSCGVPHFDIHVNSKGTKDYQNILNSFGLDANTAYIFFAMSSPYFAPGEMEIVEWVAHQCEEQVFQKNVQLIVRPHPQNVIGPMADLSWIDRLLNLNQLKNTKVDMPLLNKESNVNWSMQKSDMSRLSSLLEGSTLVINSGSTVSIDGLIHQKPIIISSFDGDMNLTYWESAARLMDYQHLAKLSNTGGLTKVSNYEQLKKEINRYLLNPKHNLDKRTYAVHQECEGLGGDATQRVVECLLYGQALTNHTTSRYKNQTKS